MPNKLEEAGISWVILGSQTKPYKPPKIEWVQEIVEACDKAGIPVFLKNNLKSLLGVVNIKATTGAPPESVYLMRQEMPSAKG